MGCHQSLSHPEHKHVGAPHRYLERSLELTSKSLDGWLDFVHAEAWLFHHFTPLTAAEDSFNPTIYDLLLKERYSKSPTESNKCFLDRIGQGLSPTNKDRTGYKVEMLI